MDLALARRVEPRADAAARSSIRTRSSSWCRRAASRKERLLGDEHARAWTVTVAGRGSKLIGGAMRDEITRAEAEELVLDGFFPRVAADARAASGGARASRSSACRTRPIRRSRATSPRSCELHGARPTAILWNGGVLKSRGDPRAHPRSADGVAGRDAARARERGARSRGRARRRLLRPRARAGARPSRSRAARRARSTSASTPRRSTPGQVTVLCLTPRGFEEGAEVDARASTRSSCSPIGRCAFACSRRRSASAIAPGNC